MSQAAQHLRRPWSTSFALRRTLAGVNPWLLGLVGVSTFALALRVVANDQQSAYMDEGTNILTGRMLIEQHAVYAEILNWSYGSYLWPLVSGQADELGGLRLVRGVAAGCGVIMVLATALAAARLAPSTISGSRRWGVALLAGGIMALAPTAVAIGRFSTYDALTGAAFMLGVALLVPAGRTTPRLHLLAAAALFFVAFLAKYIVAIYFPFVCIYLMLTPLLTSSTARVRVAVRNVAWFVVPLSAACAVYALVFLGPLLMLLGASLHYGDLKSDTPLREYVWTRPELWVLVVAAAFGLRKASWGTRLVTLGGTAIIAAFQFAARPDFDFWKHSIYVLFFLAPLAGLTWLAIPQNTGTWRVLAVTLGSLVAVWAWSPTLRQADLMINFYPNLNPSVDAIKANIAGSALILTDDTALRYYLYPQVAADDVIGPFALPYHGLDGLPAYRQAIADRFFDAIVLDGGVSPQGNAIRDQLSDTIAAAYERVYAQPDGGGFTVEVYKPVRPPGSTGAESDALNWPIAYTFDADQPGLLDWGAHPDTGNWQAGLQSIRTQEQSWSGHASLRFTPTADTSTLTLRRSGPVSRVRARVFLVPADATLTPIRIGLMGFDSTWTWRDDGFRWQIPPGVWTTITWDLANPGDYEEIGLKLPPGIGQFYVGSFEIEP